MTDPHIYRAAIFHTPRNPFAEDRALEAFPDGGLVVAAGRILAAGDYAAMRASRVIVVRTPPVV